MCDENQKIPRAKCTKNRRYLGNQNKVNEIFCTKESGKVGEISRKDAQKSPCYFKIFIEYFMNIAYNAIIR